MASKTAQTEFRRQRRHNNMGTDRKAHLRNKGTTPVFPVHTPAVDAQAPQDQVAPKTDK